MAAQAAQMEQQRLDFQTAMARMQEQHMQAMQRMQMQQHSFPQPPPMFMPPYGFIPNGPALPSTMFPMATPAFQPMQEPPMPFHSMQPQWPAAHQFEQSIQGDATANSIPYFRPMSPYQDPSYERVQFQPAAHHVEHAGMAGAPELPPEHLGKVSEFQKHVRVYNAYAMKAVSKGETHLSLAQTMARHSFAIATAFTSQLMKRYRLAPHTFKQGDTLHYTPRMVLEMSDDLFTRLYTESCSIAIEDPSQVYAILSKLEYVRQTPEEDGPLPALMRAEAAFRHRLSLLPQHAVSRCRPQELRDAFIKMVFSEEKFETMKLDFQQCATWENVYQQMMYRAGTSSAWYSDVPKHKTTPEVSVSATVSSSSPAPSKDEDKNSEASKQASAAYWKDQYTRLKRSMRFDPAILDGVTTDKARAKILQKLKYRQMLESDIRDQITKAFQQQRLRDPRDQSAERSGRPYDGRIQERRQESPRREERPQNADGTEARHHGRHQDTTHQRDGGQSGGSVRPYERRNQSPHGSVTQPSDNRSIAISSPGRPTTSVSNRQSDSRPSRSPSAERNSNK
jgi:hypothetical protein